MSEPEILLIEPFYGGSHKVLIDLIKRGIDNHLGREKSILITMTAKKWHWRARTAALYLSQVIPAEHSFRMLFASSVLNMSELMSLRPDLRDVKKIVYFHENQLIYPVRQYKTRDFQYGYNEVLTCLVADLVIFNSNFNRNSFLNSIKKYFDVLPDYRPKQLEEKIKSKTSVLYFPITIRKESLIKNYDQPLHIVWPHRWEHDKNPQSFLQIMIRLSEAKCNFKLSMIGEQFTGVVESFHETELALKDHLLDWGFVASKEKYFDILTKAHIVVSTADHEFFGVAMLEAASYKCFPLCPDKLVYPEIYPKECLYTDVDHLFNKLYYYSNNVLKLENDMNHLDINFNQFSEENLLEKYIDIFR